MLSAIDKRPPAANGRPGFAFFHFRISESEIFVVCSRYIIHMIS